MKKRVKKAAEPAMKKRKAKPAAEESGPKIHPTEIAAIASLKPHPENYRKHPETQVLEIAESIKQHGIYKNIVIAKDGTILAGHGLVLGAQKLGLEQLPVVRIPLAPDHPRARKLVAADNGIPGMAEDDPEALAALLRAIRDGDDLGLLGTGYDEVSLKELLGDEEQDPQSGEQKKLTQSLAERFGVPPFSVLDARQGYWQERKRAWLAYGIKSEEGRPANLLGLSLHAMVAKVVGYDNAVSFIEEARARGLADEQIRGEVFGNGVRSAASPAQDGTSIFDPVLCELLYRWFCPPGGSVLDPFAGGSVRGFVAAALGRGYFGCELRAEQVEANREQWKALRGALPESAPAPSWHEGDSAKTIEALPEERSGFDFVFSCPPYADLEVYSDDPADLSTMPYKQFRKVYRKVVADACARLKENRFAVFVVGEVREKGGAVGGYLGFVQETIAAFEAAGLAYYNEAILVTSVGSLSLRVGRFFSATRKLGKTHQNVLVFCKGDPRKAVEAIGDSEFGEGEVGELAAGSPGGSGVEELRLEQ